MRPANLLILMADEHSKKVLGCYGDPFVRTPHLDRLASRGTRFARAYTSSPICVPARAALATGRHVHQTGYWDNANPYDGREPSWGHWLQQRGHAVVSVGKLHYVDENALTGFDRQIIPMHVVEGVGSLLHALKDPLVVLPSASKFAKQIGPGDSSYQRYDQDITRHACDWIRARPKDESRPWVLFVSLVCPHYPLIASAELYEHYARLPLPQPKAMRAQGIELHPWVAELRRTVPYDDFFADDEARRVAVACYYALCERVDACVGRVLEALDASGLAPGTRVIYCSDHGENLGARGLWGKSTLYEESAGIPMIVAGPDIAAGRVRTTPVSLVDLYPTVLHAVTGEDPGASEGRAGASLFSIANESGDRERIVLSEYHAMGATAGAFMLTDGRNKLNHYCGLAPELYDLERDPEELDDLAARAPFARALERLQARLHAMLDPADVDRRAKASQRALIERHGGRAAVMRRGATVGTPVPGEKPDFTPGA